MSNLTFLFAYVRWRWKRSHRYRYRHSARRSRNSETRARERHPKNSILTARLVVPIVRVDRSSCRSNLPRYSKARETSACAEVRAKHATRAQIWAQTTPPPARLV